MNWLRTFLLRWLFPPKAPGVDWQTVKDAAEDARARGEPERVYVGDRPFDRDPETGEFKPVRRFEKRALHA